MDYLQSEAIKELAEGLTNLQETREFLDEVGELLDNETIIDIANLLENKIRKDG